ncbi:uncharacterized protein [Musca autumnalis]|uniref:uncharacterized protein n=1 Tax=Musca autumnalis TaxID=221902 RepID=UPI003CE700FB
MKCLLCRETIQELSRCIKRDTHEWLELKVEDLIDKHLWSMESYLPTSCICHKCWEVLYDFHKFYVRIEETHNSNSLIIKTEPHSLQKDISEALLRCLFETEETRNETINIQLEPEDETEDEPINIKQEPVEETVDEAIQIKQEPEEEFILVSENNKTIPTILNYNNLNVPNQEKREQERSKMISKNNYIAEQENLHKHVKRKQREVVLYFDHDAGDNVKDSADNHASTDNKESIDTKDSICDSDSNEVNEMYVDDENDSDDYMLLIHEILNGKGKQTSKEKERHKNRTQIRAVNNKRSLKDDKNLDSDQDEFIRRYIKITCYVCQKPFETFNLLRGHFQQEHTGSCYVVCCNLKHFNRTMLFDHLNFHIDPEYFKCKICEKVFTNRTGLNNHMKFHEPRRFTCDQCNKKFVTKQGLQHHILRHIPESERKFPCTECGRLYASQVLLNHHRKFTHESTNLRDCEICGETVRYSYNFARHMATHIGYKLNRTKFKCDKCDVVVTNNDELIAHKEQEHPLPEGDKLQNYKQHRITPKRRFKCPICNEKFSKAQILKSHLSKHTGRRVYGCPWCPKKFYTKGGIHVHRKNHHPIEWNEAKRKKLSGCILSTFKVTKDMKIEDIL